MGLIASQFPTPSLGVEGNLGKNTYDGPGYANINLNVEKGFSSPWFHGESLKLEGRGEIFNLFNRANLISFDSNLADPLFGHATATTGAQPATAHPGPILSLSSLRLMGRGSR